jgi:hypothetical protein
VPYRPSKLLSWVAGALNEFVGRTEDVYVTSSDDVAQTTIDQSLVGERLAVPRVGLERGRATSDNELDDRRCLRIG